MASSFVSVGRHYLYNSLQDGWMVAENTLFAKDNNVVLFRAKDWAAWVIFTVVFAFLIFFDNFVLNRSPKALTVGRACCYTLFWIFMACAFCGWVYYWYDYNSAFMWATGYMLEWMLSFDNLFVFHLIFQVYGTPDNLKHRPLYLGICGAVVFRLIFIFVGEYLMHAMFFMHLIFGGFLVYTGIKTCSADEDDEDPSQHPAIQWLQSKVPFVSAYDEKGAFFVQVPVHDDGELAIDLSAIETCARRVPTETDPIMSFENGEEVQAKYGTVDFTAVLEQSSRNGTGRQTQWRATMLFLVVMCLEISDVLFAVDSVSAIVAAVPDLFLAYTSAVFAMLGLRATFFIIDVLVQLFSLLKYGVSAVLIFVGVKLIIGRVYHIPPGIVCAVLVSAIASSMVASVIKDKLEKNREGKMTPDVVDVEQWVAKVTSPMPMLKSVKM